jgi:ABC-type nitrate/sulfonate/bicarbonate transport system permease component
MTRGGPVSVAVSSALSVPPSRRRIAVPALPALGAMSLLALWEVVGRTGGLGGSIPTIGATLTELTERSEVLLPAASATTLRALNGGFVGLVIGIAAAALTAWVPNSFGPVLRSAVMVNAIPVVALGPVMMSLAVRPRIPEIFAALAVVFSTVVTASAGFRAVSRASDDVFRAHGAGRAQRFFRLQVPTAMPFIADALRLAVPAAILGAVLGEWFGADLGLGVLMLSSMRNVQYSLLWATALLAVAVSVLGYLVGTLLERAATTRFGRPAEIDERTPGGGRLGAAAITLAVPVLLVLLWQWWITSGEVPAIVAPSPWGVVEALGEDPGLYLRAAGLTLLSAGGGLVSGAALGVLLAILVTLAPFLRAFLSPLALLIPTVPIVVFIPILGSILGYGVTTVLTSCVLMAFFPVYVIMLSGLTARPPGSDDLFSVYGAGRFRRMIHLALPASVPSFLVAVRLSTANCILIAISAEWLLGRGGLGRVFSEKRVLLDTGGAWAAVLVSVVLSVVAYGLASSAERRWVRRWS